MARLMLIRRDNPSLSGWVDWQGGSPRLLLEAHNIPYPMVVEALCPHHHTATPLDPNLPIPTHLQFLVISPEGV